MQTQSGYEAVYVSEFPSTDHSVTIGMAWLVDRVANHDVTGVVIAPSRPDFNDHVPLQAAKRLFVCETWKTVRSSRTMPHGPKAVLAVWPNADAIAKIEDWVFQLDSMCVVPWIPSEIDVWARARGAYDLMGNTSTAPTPTISDPVVARAMKSFTMMVNLGSGLTHPSDKAVVVQGLKALKKHGYRWDVDELVVWALANGWSQRGAGDLRKYAEGIRDGKSFQTARAMLRADIVAQWEQDVRENSQ